MEWKRGVDAGGGRALAVFFLANTYTYRLLDMDNVRMLLG